MDMLVTILPLVFLILFGFVLQRLRFFEDISFKRMQSFLLKVTLPCLLFTVFSGMEFVSGQFIITAGMLVFMITLLLIGLLLYRILRIKHEVFVFFISGFGFGTVALPVFIEVFGIENAYNIVPLGIGNELFASSILIPALHIYYCKGSAKLSAFLSPAIIMVVLGVLTGLSNLGPVITSNFIGASLFEAISRVGSLTLPISLILIGYRIRLSDKGYLKISAMYAAARLIIGISLGIAFRFFFLDSFIPYFHLLDSAFFIIILQHGSLAPQLYVGQYGSTENQIIANNAFVINMAVGMVLTFIYLITVTA